MQKINWTYIKGVFLIALLAILYGFSNNRNEARKIRNIKIEFEGDSKLFMSYEMVNKLLIQNGKTVKNQSKSVIDLHKLEVNVQSHPMVENVSVFTTVNGELFAKVQQRTPIARVVVNRGSYYIDKQGKTMPLSPIYADRVLLVTGDVDEKDNSKIYFLTSEILKDEFLRNELVGIQKLPNEEFVLHTRDNHHKIILGNLNGLTQKFKNLKAFYVKAIADKTIANYRTLNLKYNNRVVCTK